MCPEAVHDSQTLHFLACSPTHHHSSSGKAPLMLSPSWSFKHLFWKTISCKVHLIRPGLPRITSVSLKDDLFIFTSKADGNLPSISSLQKCSQWPRINRPKPGAKSSLGVSHTDKCLKHRHLSTCTGEARIRSGGRTCTQALQHGMQVSQESPSPAQPPHVKVNLSLTVIAMQ